MKNRRLFISIFAMSLAVTLLVSPVKVFNNPVVETIQVRAEEEPITDTQRGIALLMTIMLAQGLRFVGDWNTVVQPGLQKLWEDFSTATGNAVTFPMIVAGSSLALGYIRTSNTVNNAIANFTAWYKQTYSQPTSGNVSIPVGGDGTYYPVSGSDCIYMSFSGVSPYQRHDYYSYNNVSDGRGVLFKNTNSVYYKLVLASTSSFTGGFSAFSSQQSSCTINYDSAVYNSTYNFYYIFKQFQPSGNKLQNIFINYPIVYLDHEAQAQDFYAYTFGSSASLGDISMEGQSLELQDGYQLESDQAKLYDIAGLEALVASLALTLENIDDLVRDIPLIFDTPWAEDFPDVPSYVDTPDDTIPWVDVPDSVIPADTPEYVPTIPSERDEYKVLGLDQVFPFSIPFDLYYLSQILVSEPQTPEFQYAAVNPVNGNLLTIDVDLHDFDGVASIFRTCETVLFIAFLIWVTRSLIRS